MKVILFKDVKKIGKKFETKEVSNGYALNMLIPKGLAEVYTEKGENKVKMLIAQEAAHKGVQEELLHKNISGITGIAITIAEKANEKGHLFAQVHADEIVAAVKAQKQIDILPEFIQIEKPIKEVGAHEVSVKVKDKIVTFTLTVEAK